MAGGGAGAQAKRRKKISQWVHVGEIPRRDNETLRGKGLLL